FGTTAKPILFRRGAKHWRAQRVHPGLDWNGTEGAKIEAAAIRHDVDRDISDMLRRLDRYSSLRAADLLESGDIGTLPGNLRRFFSRFFKALVTRRGYREGGWGLLLAFCAGLFPSPNVPWSNPAAAWRLPPPCWCAPWPRRAMRSPCWPAQHRRSAMAMARSGLPLPRGRLIS
ncbi:MAG: hypothetical protein EBX37_15675, partial [Alphaproteobacteria bacterium]|nr:hypothetical protein [Alphaproteobacteria bacterium]